MHVEPGYVEGFGCVMSDVLAAFWPGDFYLKQSDSKFIKTAWTTMHNLLSAAVNGAAVRALALVMNVSWPDLWRMGYWPRSKWLKIAQVFLVVCFELCVTQPWRVQLWAIDCSLLEKVSAFPDKAFLLPETCVAQSNSALYPPESSSKPWCWQPLLLLQTAPLRGGRGVVF